MWLSVLDFDFFRWFCKVKEGIWKVITALQINLYSLFTNTFRAIVTSSYEGIEKEEES